jgi:hypothetical protein
VILFEDVNVIVPLLGIDKLPSEAEPVVVMDTAEVILEPSIFAVALTVPVETEKAVSVSTSFEPVLTTILVIFNDPFLPESEVIVTLTESLLPLTVNTLDVIVPSSDDRVPLDTLLKVTDLMYISDLVVLKSKVKDAPLALALYTSELFALTLPATFTKPYGIVA